MSQVVLTERPVTALDPPPPPRPWPDRTRAPDPALAAVPGTAPEGPQTSPRVAFRRRCERLARRLAEAPFEERIAIYTGGEDRATYRELSTAAALCPDLMPLVNGEYEWIALTLADLD